MEIANYFKEQAPSGRTVFYDIYTEEEKAEDPEKEDPEKEDPGLFFSGASGSSDGP